MDQGRPPLPVSLLSLVRVKQWSKNLFLFGALVFARKLLDIDALFLVVRGFFAFSFAASTIYIINDLADRKEDRLHPAKCRRPLASGAVGTAGALITALVTLAAAVLLTLGLPRTFAATLLLYVLMQVFYTFLGKKMVIVDALIIALGFVLRVAAGGFAIEVPISSWLILCTFFLALFLAFCKRRNELSTLEEASNHRAVLGEYSLPFLDQMINTATAATVLCYALYVTSPMTMEKFHSPYLVLTVPFVVYGIYRYLYLLHRKNLGGNPTDVLLGDLPFSLNLLGWILASIAIVYTGS